MSRLKFFHQGLTPDLVKRAKEELGETEEVKAKTLKELKNLLTTEPDLHPCTEDDFLLRFLRNKKFNVARAFDMIKRYYKYRASYPEIIKKPSDVMHILEEGHFSFMENRDDNNGAVVMYRLAFYDIGKHKVDDLLAFLLVAFEIGLMVEANQICGYTAIDDLTDFSLYHAKHYASPSLLRKLVAAIQDCIPARFNGFHAVNEPFYYNVVIRLVKMFMSEKLRKRLNVHGSNFKALHEFFPPEILPEEVGGTQGPLSKGVAVLREKFILYGDHFEKMMKYGYQGQTLKNLRKKRFLY